MRIYIANKGDINNFKILIDQILIKNLIGFNMRLRGQELAVGYLNRQIFNASRKGSAARVK